MASRLRGPSIRPKFDTEKLLWPGASRCRKASTVGESRFSSVRMSVAGGVPKAPAGAGGAAGPRGCPPAAPPCSVAASAPPATPSIWRRVIADWLSDRLIASPFCLSGHLYVGTHRVFPLAVGELPDLAAVAVHQEHLGVGLRRDIEHRGLILESRARTFEPDLASIGGPKRIRIPPHRAGEPLHVTAVHVHGEDLEVEVGHAPREHHSVARRRDEGKVVKSGCQHLDRVVRQIDGAQPAGVGRLLAAPYAIDDGLAIRVPGRETGIHLALCYLPALGAVGFHHVDIGWC